MAYNKTKTAGIFWDDNKGPLENLFHLVEVGGLVWPGTPGIAKLLLVVSSFFNIGFAELGKFFDEKLGLNSLQDINKMDARNAAENITVNLFDISREELAAEAFLYTKNFNKIAYPKPLSLYKTALDTTMIRKISKGKAGLIGMFFNHILKIFSWAWAAFKAVLLGGVGVLALQGTDVFHDSNNSQAKERVVNEEDDDLSRGIIDISTKKSPNRYKKKLENRIDSILSK